MSQQPPTTPNHGYIVPTPGADEDVWGEYLNTNLGSFDRDIPITESLVNRPPAGQEGRLFFAVDQDPPTISYDTGTQWLDVWDGDAVSRAGDTLDGALEFTDASANHVVNQTVRLSNANITYYVLVAPESQNMSALVGRFVGMRGNSGNPVGRVMDVNIRSNNASPPGWEQSVTELTNRANPSPEASFVTVEYNGTPWRALKLDMTTAHHGFNGAFAFTGIKSNADLLPIPADDVNLNTATETARATSGELKINGTTVADTEYVDTSIDAALAAYEPPPGSGSGTDLSHWNVIDVSNHGFPGDGTGGDIMDFMRMNGPAHFILPEGRYRVESELAFNAQNWNYIGIEGTGAGATLDVATTNVGLLFQSGYSSTSLDYGFLKNLTVELDPVNQIDAGFGAFACNERLLIEDITIDGKRTYHSLHPDTGGPGLHGSMYNCRVNMLNPDSVAHVRNVRIMDGGQGADRPRVIPFNVEPPNQGTVFWDGCHVAGFQGNGFYLKDGYGSSIVMGCSAQNIGGQGIRIGDHDMIINSRTINDARVDLMDHNAGTHVDVDLAQGTSVLGHRAIAERATNDIIRVRGGNEQCSLRDIWVENYTTHYALDVGSTYDGADYTNPRHGDAKLVIDNFRAIQHGAPSSIRSEQTRITRDNTVLQNSSIRTERDWHWCLTVESGDAIIQNCNFEAVGAGDRTVTVGGTTSGPRIAQLENCYMDRPIGLRNLGTTQHVGVVGCLINGGPWVTGAAPADAGLTSYTFFRNPGHAEQTVNGMTISTV